MALERFFIERRPDTAVVRLSREEVHHLRRVRRVRPGDEVVLFDGSGTDYFGRVQAFDGLGVTVEIHETRPGEREPDLEVTIAVSIVKPNRMDQLIDSCTQLGMRRLVPMLTERSVVRPAGRSAERWPLIAIEACKQSGRSLVPEIAPVGTLAEVLETARGYDAAVIGSTRPDAAPLISAVVSAPRPARTVVCLIGPEGGFTEAEEDAAIAAGCAPVALAKSILRTETAAATALALIIGGAAGTVGRAGRRASAAL